MLTLFGSVAVGAMLLFYWLEPRWRWSLLPFAAACGATSAYSALEGVYPITGIEALWALVAAQRFVRARRKRNFKRNSDPSSMGP
jgi:hypothetical protein